MEKVTAIEILKMLYRKIETEQIHLDCVCFQEEIKNEHLTALSMAINSLKENP